MGDSSRRRPALRADLEKFKIVSPEREEERHFEENLELGGVVDKRLSILFRNISIEDDTILGESLSSVVSYIDDHMESPELMRELIFTTFAMSLEDREFATKAGALYGVIHMKKVGDDTVRTILLSSIQKELEENDFQKGNRLRFLNAVFLLSELYYHVQIDNHPISILGGELIKYFRWLLTGEEKELEVLATCLIVNGLVLKKDKPASYRKLMTELRIALVSRNVSTLSRSWLLLVVDMDNVNFKSLSEDLLICHMTFIGDQGFRKLKRTRPIVVPPTSIQNKSPNNVRPAPYEKRRSPERRRSPDRRRSTEKRHSPGRRRSPERRYSPERPCSPENWDLPSKEWPPSVTLQSPERWSPEPQPTAITGRPVLKRVSPPRQCTVDEWHSPTRVDASDRRHSSDAVHHNDSYKPTRGGRWSMGDSATRSQRPEGQHQRGQLSQGSTGQKSNYERRTTNPGTGHGSYKNERRIPVWQHEHDDRFDRDYES